MSALAPTSAETGRETLTSERYPMLVFFDGECAFCNAWANRLRAADTAHRIRFGAKQGVTFQRVAQEHPEVARVDSIVLVARRADGGEDFLVRSKGVARAIDGLPAFGLFSFVLKITPTPLADFGYWIVSKLRKLIMGRMSYCRVPTAEERPLFVD